MASLANLTARWKRWLTHKLVREHLGAFLAQQATNESLLDLGCGKSSYSYLFPNRIGVDISWKPGVNVIADSHRLPFLSSCIPLVLTTEMLEHVKDPQRVVDEIERVLRPGGKIILTTRFIFPLHEAPLDFYRFTKYGLEHIFRNWINVEIKPDTSSFEAMGILFQRMAIQTDFRGGRFTTLGCLLLSKAVTIMDSLTRTQYGDSSRTKVEREITTSGYYVVAYKRPS